MASGAQVAADLLGGINMSGTAAAATKATEKAAADMKKMAEDVRKKMNFNFSGMTTGMTSGMGNFKVGGFFGSSGQGGSGSGSGSSGQQGQGGHGQSGGGQQG